MIRSFLLLVANLLLLASLAAGDDEGCSGFPEFDATLKGNLSSPMFGKRPHYAPNLNCYYRIKAAEGHKIKLTFKVFDVDVSQLCTQDKLTIFGKDHKGILGSYCGQDLPRPLLSEDNELILVFQTDYIQEKRGYLIEYESGPDMQLCESGLRLCGNRNCYDPKKVCDGVDDCGDGTDEENCLFALHVTPAECGTPEIRPRTILGADRMVGGEEVVPNSWPWQVSLQVPYIEPNGHICGGTLINSVWVLTATHCVVGRSNRGEIKIVLGAHGKFTKTSYQQVRTSVRVIAYPELLGDDTKDFSLMNDVSLIRLNAPVQMTAGVHPACLPYWGYNPQPGWTCYATGWGETRGTGSSHALKQTLQHIKTQAECPVSNETNQVCVGNTGMSGCHGDSGGPLHCEVRDKWYLVGAASYVTSDDLNNRGLCAGPGAYTVYATTAYKFSWIVDMIVKYSQMYSTF